MPLVALWLQPGYEIGLTDIEPGAVATSVATYMLIHRDLANSLPELFVDNAGILGLVPDTPLNGVQITNFDFGPYDVNTPSIWLDIRFSEARPDEMQCQTIREKLYELIMNWFKERDLAPDNLVIDLAWGPTHGKGTVDGVEIKW